MNTTTMTNRITNKDLENVCKRINQITNSPLESYTCTLDTMGVKTFIANIGNYHIDGAYGGVALHRMDNKSGGITDVLRCGHVSKKELYNRMHAFIAGLESSLTLKGNK